MNTTTVSTVAPAVKYAPVVIDGHVLNRSAERRFRAAELRNAIIAAAPAYAAYTFANAPAPALDAVVSASRAYANSLCGMRNGEKLVFSPVPAAALMGLACTFVKKGTEKAGNARMVWNVRKEGALKAFFTVSTFERAETCENSVPAFSDKDYKQDKAPASRKSVKSTAPVTPFDKLVSSLYAAAKNAAKAEFDAVPANIEKKFMFPCQAEWKAANLPVINSTAALMGIKAA